MYWEQIRCPRDQLSIDQPSMTFDLKQSPELTDLSDSFWTGKIKLQKLTDGTWGNIDAANDKVGPANNYFYCLFSDQVYKIKNKNPCCFISRE